VSETSDGDLLAGLHINYAELHGMAADDMEWVGVAPWIVVTGLGTNHEANCLLDSRFVERGY
jgi:hypothetical protein